MKKYTVFYKCPFCKQSVAGEVFNNSRLIKCQKPGCGKYSDISLVDGFEEHKEEFEAGKSKDNGGERFTGKHLAVSLILLVIVVVSIFLIFF